MLALLANCPAPADLLEPAMQAPPAAAAWCWQLRLQQCRAAPAGITQGQSSSEADPTCLVLLQDPASSPSIDRHAAIALEHDTQPETLGAAAWGIE